ncbi:MAG: hypothetical protein EPN37_08170 [Chitinophagaceae bacterium]|nr:MAG: hypothetical protein EPN37_08170 [Chitinophagaceae bacterium]
MFTGRIFYGIIAIFIVVYTGCRSNINPYNKQWEKYLNKAKEAHKYLIVDFSTSWCMPCKILEKEVLANDTVINFMKSSSTLLSIDAEKKIGIPLAMKYSITAYPTLLIFDTSGILICDKVGIDGIGTPAQFISFLNDVFEGKDILPAKGFTSFLPSIHTYPLFYRQYFTHRTIPDSSVVTNYLSKQSNPLSETNWAVIKVFGNDSMKTFVVKNAAKYMDIYGCTVLSMILGRVQKSLGDDILNTKDSVQFKKDLAAFIRLKEPLLGKQAATYRKYLITLNFWSLDGLNWKNFLSEWHKYHSSYGTDLDDRAAKYVDDRCDNDVIRAVAEGVLLDDLKHDPNNWKILTGLANLLDKDKYLQSDKNQLEFSDNFNNSMIHRINLNSDSLYEQAIKTAKGDQKTIIAIVGLRLNSGLHIPNEKGWQETMRFFKKNCPKDYAHGFGSSMMVTYYEVQRRWTPFVKYADKWFTQMFITNHINSELVNKVNAHDMYHYADEVYNHAKTLGQIDTAIHWMMFLSNKYPQEEPYKKEYDLLKEKHDELSGKQS